eukprot:15485220-Alexandrium_andersonii.AAC.1
MQWLCATAAGLGRDDADPRATCASPCSWALSNRAGRGGRCPSGGARLGRPTRRLTTACPGGLSWATSSSAAPLARS